MGTAKSVSTLEDLRATRKRKSRHNLVIGNWSIISLRGKEHELVEEAKRLSLDIAGISSTKRCGSNIAELDNGWKLFCSGVESAQFAQAGVEILVSFQLANFVDEWIPRAVADTG